MTNLEKLGLPKGSFYYGELSVPTLPGFYRILPDDIIRKCLSEALCVRLYPITLHAKGSTTLGDALSCGFSSLSNNFDHSRGKCINEN